MQTKVKIGRPVRSVKYERKITDRSDDDYLYHLVALVAVERGLAQSIRLAANVSQATVGADIGTVQATIAQWERGYARPAFDISTAYGKKLIELIHMEPSRLRRISWCKRFPMILRQTCLKEAERGL